MPTRKSNDYKLSAVNYYLVENISQDEVCKIFKCSRRSLMRLVNRYKTDGNVDIHYRKPIAYKVKKEHVDFLLQEIKKNKTITIEDLLYLLKNKYPGVDLNKSHINQIIQDNNITLKITRIRHEPVKRFGKDIDIYENKEQLQMWIKDIKQFIAM
jgi:transposase